MKNIACIEITKRLCSPKQSTLVEVGKRYYIKGEDNLKDGTKVIIVNHPTKKKETLRINEKRFRWRKISVEQLKEESFRKTVAADVKRIKEAFSVQEQIQIAIIPIIIAHLAWIYAMQVAQMCAENRIEELKKVVRCVRMLRNEYLNELMKDLRQGQITHLEKQAEVFMNEYEYHFTIFFFSINREMLAKMPDTHLAEMRSKAIAAMCMIKLLDEHNAEMDQLISKKTAQSKANVRMPIIDALYDCMDACASVNNEFNIENNDIVLSTRIIRQKLKQATVDVDLR